MSRVGLLESAGETQARVFEGILMTMTRVLAEGLTTAVSVYASPAISPSVRNIDRALCIHPNWVFQRDAWNYNGYILAIFEHTHHRTLEGPVVVSVHVDDEKARLQLERVKCTRYMP